MSKELRHDDASSLNTEEPLTEEEQAAEQRVIEQPLGRDYYKWFTGNTVLDLGVSMQFIAIPLIAFAVTGSTASAGVIGMASSLGMLLATLPAGVVADRVPRRTFVTFGALVDALLAGVFAWLIFTDNITMLWLIILAFTMEFVSQFVGITNDALLKNIVTTEQFPKVSAINQGRNAAIGLISGPLAGFLFGIAHFIPIAFHSFACLFRSGTIATISVNPLGTSQKKTHWVSDMLTGISLILRVPMFRYLSLFAAFINFGATAVFLTIVLYIQKTSGNPALAGLTYGVMSGGMLIGAIIASKVATRYPTGKLIVIQFIISSVFFGMVAVNTNPYWLLTWWGLSGIVVPIGNAALAGYFMASIPSELQGRIGSAFSLLVLILMPLAPLSSGVLLEHAGIHVTLAAFAAIFVISTVLTMFNRSLLHIPAPPYWEEYNKHVESFDLLQQYTDDLENDKNPQP
ncbi:MFS transporter [Actinomyces vulturis]|uniref:MFS transporter n=1 Tax=Actinomyces vulturis TaxID=1857645 RepID=UPI00083288A1|nr:MFS transporter [Actinomyces vulturis]